MDKSRLIDGKRTRANQDTRVMVRQSISGARRLRL